MVYIGSLIKARLNLSFHCVVLVVTVKDTVVVTHVHGNDSVLVAFAQEVLDCIDSTGEV